jgi:hypothetical protein
VFSARTNTTYIASYFGPAGHYSVDDFYFEQSGVDAPPLHALANGVDGPNGVYVYGSAGGFPITSFRAENYWVDVIYTNISSYTISGSITGPGGPGATVNLSGAATASEADASGAYSFSGLANGSYTVTPSKTGYTFSPSSRSTAIASANVMGLKFVSH